MEANVPDAEKEPDEAVSFVTKNLGSFTNEQLGGDLSALFTGSAIVRDVIADQAVFIARSVRQLMHLAGSKRRFRIGIIGCGQIGSAIATPASLVSQARP